MPFAIPGALKETLVAAIQIKAVKASRLSVDSDRSHEDPPGGIGDYVVESVAHRANAPANAPPIPPLGLSCGHIPFPKEQPGSILLERNSASDFLLVKDRGAPGGRVEAPDSSRRNVGKIEGPLVRMPIGAFRKCRALAQKRDGERASRGELLHAQK